MNKKMKTDRSAYRISRLAAALLTVFLLSGFFIVRARAEISAWQRLQAAMNQAENNAVVILSEDVKALEGDSVLSVASGQNITLDLNGHTLDRNLKEYRQQDGAVLIIQEGAILSIRDSGEPGGVITGGYHDNGGGIVNHGSLIMDSGCVTGNTAVKSGGGIANYGSMILMGGRITGNTSLREGGGIYNHAKAHLTVYGSTVFSNSAPRHQDICNEGMMSLSGIQPDGTYAEDMPVLKSFMIRLSIYPNAVVLFSLLLVVWLDAYLTPERKRAMVLIIVLVFGLLLQNYLEYRFAPDRKSVV